MAKTTGSLLLKIIVITVVAGGIFLALDHFLLPKGKSGTSGLTREQAEQIGREIGTEIGRQEGERIGREIAAEMLAQRGTTPPESTTVAEETPTDAPSTEVSSSEPGESPPPPAPTAPPPEAVPAPAPAPTPPPTSEPAPAPEPEPTPSPAPMPAAPAAAPEAADPAPAPKPAKEPSKFPRNASVTPEPASAWWERSQDAKKDALVVRYAGQLSASDKASSGIALLFSGRFDKSVAFSSITVSGPSGPVSGEWQLGANPGVIYLPAVPDGTYTVTIPAGFKDADGRSIQRDVSGPVTVKRN